MMAMSFRLSRISIERLPTTLNAAMMDYISDAQVFPIALVEDKAYEFHYQRYVLHASLADCTHPTYSSKNCFYLSKEVTIDNERYDILAINKSTMLGQMRVMISLKN